MVYKDLRMNILLYYLCAMQCEIVSSRLLINKLFGLSAHECECVQDVVGGSELPRALLTFLHLPTGDLTAAPSTYSNTNSSNYGSSE